MPPKLICLCRRLIHLIVLRFTGGCLMTWRYTGPLESDPNPTNNQNSSADSAQTFLSEIRMHDWTNQWRTGEKPLLICNSPKPWTPHWPSTDQLQDRINDQHIPQYLPPFDLGPLFGGCCTPHPLTTAEEEGLRKFIEDYRKTHPLDTRES